MTTSTVASGYGAYPSAGVPGGALVEEVALRFRWKPATGSTGSTYVAVRQSGVNRAHKSFVITDGAWRDDTFVLRYNPLTGLGWTAGDVNGGLEFVFQSVDAGAKPRVTQAYVEVRYRTVTGSTVYAGGAYEKKSDGSVTKYYAAGGAKVVRQVPPGGGAGTLSWLLSDHLGTTVGALDGAGALVAAQRYWPYGAVRSGGIAVTDKLYTGQQEEPGDALGLYNYRARFYSTTLGRFVSGDPVSASFGSSALSRFAYANSNPLRFMDPDGYDPTPADYSSCEKNVVLCLWWSAGGKADSYISMVAEWFQVPANVLAAIVLNEVRSVNLKDDLAELVGTQCVHFDLERCKNASYGPAQIKLETAKIIEAVSPEFQHLAHDESLIVARLKNPLWGIAYAAALLRYYKENIFNEPPTPFSPQRPITDADYIVAYKGNWRVWMQTGGCDTCGNTSPGQIRKVRALEVNAVQVLSRYVGDAMEGRSANQ